MNRVDRLFGIMTLLQSKKFVPAEKIADKFGISVRTVYRDVKALCEQGIPVSFEQNRGYFIVQGYFLPPVSFSSEEANALLLMETVVSAFSDRSIQKHYTAALDKVKAVMRGGQKDDMEQLSRQIELRVPQWHDTSYEYLSGLQNAISARQIIEIAYKNSKEESSKRELEPIGLIFYSLSWHLIGWCHKRKDYRDFRVSRIVKLRNTEKPFTKKKHMELADYMKMLPINC